MPNTYFQFKKFIVHQDKCAMKVCTDACLFGAWVAYKISTETHYIKYVLDIGTGTGLLSLMLAQGNPYSVTHAVEIDEQAAKQASENFLLSPWSSRLNVLQEDIKHIPLELKYNLIVCNPPFFENDLKSKQSARNVALHSDALTLQELIVIADKLLDTNGKFAVLLPFIRSESFEKTATKHGFYLYEKMLVKQTEKHNFFRTMLLFGKNKTETSVSQLTIKLSNSYSADFVTLLKDYYLHF